MTACRGKKARKKSRESDLKEVARKKGLAQQKTREGSKRMASNGS